MFLSVYSNVYAAAQGEQCTNTISTLAVSFINENTGISYEKDWSFDGSKRGPNRQSKHKYQTDMLHGISRPKKRRKKN